MNKNILHSVFESVAEQLPAQTALEYGHRKLSYSQLNVKANRAAHILRALGVEQESTVTVLLGSNINLIVSILAIFKSGGVYVPLDLNFSKKRLLQVFGQTQSNVLITDSASQVGATEMLKGLGVLVKYLVVLDEDSNAKTYTLIRDLYELLASVTVQNDENLPVLCSDDGGNYIFYTSGSTGDGKAILGCHKGLSHFIHWEIDEFKIDQTFRISQLIQPTFDPSLRDIFVPLGCGATLCIPTANERSNMYALIEWLDEFEITLMHFVPSLFRLMTKELRGLTSSGGYFKKLRFILLSGEMLYAKDVKSWRELMGDRAQLVNLYGPTETTLAKAFYRIGEVSDIPGQAIPVGKPIRDTFIAIINSQNKLCGKGEKGEIYIKTPFMSKGYYKNNELTKNAFIQNPLIKDKVDIVYKTGDVGKYLDGWIVEITGRNDDQLKVNGVRVELSEIHNAVSGITGVDESLIVPYKNKNGEVELICYYASNSVDRDALRRTLEKDLNRNIIPAHIIKLDRFPLNINGKVDRKALPLPESISSELVVRNLRPILRLPWQRSGAKFLISNRWASILLFSR